ncbi:helix-turn-helix domain-containing protein [Streptomyces coeruleorubidus]|uniref:helix-turn-helix domain-containing protein n=1 Tax=Streptomyces coeruleorubidus TaxID=116188 RepID=UPI0033D2A25C
MSTTRGQVPSGLWSGQPISVKLADLDVICAVLGCQISELLIPEPETVTAPAPEEAPRQAAGQPPHVTPRAPRGRSLPPT